MAPVSKLPCYRVGYFHLPIFEAAAASKGQQKAELVKKAAICRKKYYVCKIKASMQWYLEVLDVGETKNIT